MSPITSDKKRLFTHVSATPSSFGFFPRHAADCRFRRQSYSGILISFSYLCCATGGAYELSVAPSGAEFIKAVGQSAVFTCSALGAGSPNDRVEIKWKDHVGRLVGENTAGSK